MTHQNPNSQFTNLPTTNLPAELYIEVTNRCNSQCQTCVRTFETLEPLRNLTLDEFRSLVDQAPGLGRAVLHGVGEPLLNRNLPAMIAHLKGRSNPPQVLFNSNATLLTPEWQAALLNAGLDEFRISTDAAHPQLYRRIRGLDAFDQMTDNVAAFARRIEQAGTGPRLSLWFTAMHENLAELPALVRLAARQTICKKALFSVFFDCTIIQPNTENHEKNGDHCRPLGHRLADRRLRSDDRGHSSAARAHRTAAHPDRRRTCRRAHRRPDLSAHRAANDRGVIPAGKSLHCARRGNF